MQISYLSLHFISLSPHFMQIDDSLHVFALNQDALCSYCSQMKSLFTHVFSTVLTTAVYDESLCGFSLHSDE